MSLEPQNGREGLSYSDGVREAPNDTTAFPSPPPLSSWSHRWDAKTGYTCLFSAILHELYYKPRVWIQALFQSPAVSLMLSSQQSDTFGQTPRFPAAIHSPQELRLSRTGHWAVVHEHMLVESVH